jgi:plastocyanin
MRNGDLLDGRCRSTTGGRTNNLPAPATVEATPSLAFTPNSLTVKRGDKVTFAFGMVPHNVTFDNRDAKTPAISPV